MRYATLAILPAIASAETSSSDYGTMMERMAQSRVGICQIGDQAFAITYGSDSDTTWAAVEGNSSVTEWTVTSASITDGVLTIAGKNEMIRYSGTKVIGLIGDDTIEGTCVDASSPVNRAIASLLPETDPDDTFGLYRQSMIDEVQSLRRSLATARTELTEALAAQQEARASEREVRDRLAAEREVRDRLAAELAARPAAEGARLEEEAVQLERYRAEFFGQLREVLGDREGVEIVGDRFVFSSEVLFAQGEVELQPEGREQIAQVAGVILDIADQIPPDIDWVLRVDGHTDDVPLSGSGRYASNWELSQGRALSVVLYMINALGVPPSRLAPTGFGEFRPVDTSGTPEGRARNRRIELKLTER